ncbi:class F sortase [Saccharopolyspora sp. ASAGF58]|uniref:class F sortase n=1 Tax=Saccharopolyspora sp. ASAGF58 TaxID=2719023 RepID=UPI001FF0B781|nr:class F sortase [Saccharopolyspora sp. ASAGF58]
MRAGVLALWITLLLSAAGAAVFGPAGADSAPPPAAAPAPVVPATSVPGDPHPIGIAMPSIRVASSLVPLGLNADGSVQVPPIETPRQAGWYDGGAGAGEVGPFVVLGHVDSYTEAGVFYRLRDLRAGDRIRVDRRDGSQVTYLVDRIERFPKDKFPTDAVYGDVPRPEIRLITCGGDFDKSRRSYEDNLIVFGHLA